MKNFIGKGRTWFLRPFIICAKGNVAAPVAVIAPTIQSGRKALPRRTRTSTVLHYPVSRRSKNCERLSTTFLTLRVDNISYCIAHPKPYRYLRLNQLGSFSFNLRLEFFLTLLDN